MKFSSEKPSIFEKCRERFGVNWDSVIITYGDTIYSKNPPVDNIIVHEKVHIKQQAEIGADAWWDRYFEDKDFRLLQELEAHKAQLKFIRENYPRPERRRWEKHIYSSFAGNYGGIITKELAKELLK